MTKKKLAHGAAQVKQNPSSDARAVRWDIALPIVLVVAIIVAFQPALDNRLTNWDDEHYIVDNPHIRELSVSSIGKAFGTYYMGNYHPLTMISYAMEYAVNGQEPRLYIISNITLHICTTLLLFFFIRRLTGNLAVAFVTAALFALHPLRVESVVWVSERKDVLYALFFFASLLAYTQYVKGGPRLRLYAAFALFVLACFSKGQAVVLPPLFLLIDYFAGKKFNKATILEKVPFFLVALIFGIVAVFAQQSIQAVITTDSFSLLERVAIALNGFMQYLAKTVSLTTLSPYHPYPRMEDGALPLYYYLVSLVILAGIVALLVLSRKNRSAMLGLLWYVVCIAPLLQLLPIGGAAAADRYSYVALVGPVFLLSSAIVGAWEKKKRDSTAIRNALPAAFAAVLVVLIFLTRAQSDVWQDSVSLWSEAIRAHPDIALPYQMRGNAHRTQNNHEGAVADFSYALAINPALTDVMLLRASSCKELKRYDAALSDYTHVLEREPKNTAALNNRGSLYLETGLREAALQDFLRAIEQEPRKALSWFNAGTACLDLGRHDEAMRKLTRAIQLDKDYTEAYYNRGNAYFELQNLDAALADYTEVVERTPEDKSIWYNRGNVQQLLGRFREAMADYDEALRIDPNFEQARHNRDMAESMSRGR